MSPTPSSRGNESTTQNTLEDSSSPTAAIAGGVVGGVVALMAVIGLIFFFMRRRKRSWVETNQVSCPVTPSTSGINPDAAAPATIPEREMFFKAELPTTEMYTMEQAYAGVGELPASPINIKGYYYEPGPASEPQEVPASPVIPGMGVHVPKPEQALMQPHEPQELP